MVIWESSQTTWPSGPLSWDIFLFVLTRSFSTYSTRVHPFEGPLVWELSQINLPSSTPIWGLYDTYWPTRPLNWSIYRTNWQSGSLIWEICLITLPSSCSFEKFIKEIRIQLRPFETLIKTIGHHARSVENCSKQIGNLDSSLAKFVNKSGHQGRPFEKFLIQVSCLFAKHFRFMCFHSFEGQIV